MFPDLMCCKTRVTPTARANQESPRSPGGSATWC